MSDTLIIQFIGTDFLRSPACEMHAHEMHAHYDAIRHHPHLGPRERHARGPSPARFPLLQSTFRVISQA
jgi:hypothetical protein